MTYPQPKMLKDGFLHLFTKYTGIRQLYFETSKDGVNWTEDKLLAAIPQNEGEQSGHYQVSSVYNNKKAGTFFNRHPQGNVDKRTDLYYAQTTDFAENWTKIRKLTEDSEYNHSYVRRPVDYKAPFCFFWASGHPHEFTKSELYFGDFAGNIWKLPYEMKDDFMKPIKIK